MVSRTLGTRLRNKHNKDVKHRMSNTAHSHRQQCCLSQASDTAMLWFAGHRHRDSNNFMGHRNYSSMALEFFSYLYKESKHLNWYHLEICEEHQNYLIVIYWRRVQISLISFKQITWLKDENTTKITSRPKQLAIIPENKDHQINITYSSIPHEVIDWNLINVDPWGQLNIKMMSYQYRDSHYKEKTASWQSYLCNGNPYTKKDSL